jgi:phosphoserine aminotransferase
MEEVYMDLDLIKPERPFFSSGPCPKPVEWSVEGTSSFLGGRSHRSVPGLERIEKVIDGVKQLLEIPKDYRVLLTAGSATAAMEMALWNFLGPRPVDSLQWDVWSRVWTHDLVHELRVETHILEGPLPHVFSLGARDHDLVLTWCGTTHGMCVNHCDEWLLPSREGLVICDATSAVLTTHLPWDRLDVTAFSWQKGLGGEASLGVLVVSPKAMERLYSHTPSWPIPRLFRLKNKGGVIEGVFRGEVINTCSLWIVEEALHLLDIWRDRGGLPAALKKTDENFSLIAHWCAHQEWIDFLEPYAPCRSRGPVCLKLTAPHFEKMQVADQWSFLNKMGDFLSIHQAGFDLINHALSVPSLRLWCGPAVEREDIRRLLPWIEHAYRFTLSHL